MSQKQEIFDGLAPLFAEAENTGKWFWCRYQDLWFSPAKLREAQAGGQFVWGAVNWVLRDPKERVSEAQSRVDTAQAKLDAAKSQLNPTGPQDMEQAKNCTGCGKPLFTPGHTSGEAIIGGEFAGWYHVGCAPKLPRQATEIERMRAKLVEEHSGGHRLMGEFCPTCQASPKL